MTISRVKESRRQQKVFRNKRLSRKIGKEMVDLLEDPIYEMRITKIASKYLKTYFIFELLACAPILVFEASYRFTTDYQEVKELHIDSALYRLFYALKLFKLLAFPKVAHVANTIVAEIKDYFYVYRGEIQSAYVIVATVLKAIIIAHVMVCFWLRIEIIEDSEAL